MEKRARGVIAPGCIQYRECTQVHFSAVVCVYIYILVVLDLDFYVYIQMDNDESRYIYKTRMYINYSMNILIF
jgi:hypothetical protein